MASPALLLSNILASIPKSDGHKKLIVAIADHLELQSGDVEDQVVVHVRGLVVQCHSIIDTLSFLEGQKAVARRFLDPVEGFRQYSAFSYDINQAENPILHPSTITGLQTLDMILSPRLLSKTITPEIKKAVDMLRDALTQVNTLGMSEQLLTLVKLRILQVIEGIQHFEFFGEASIQVRIDALIGQVAIANTERSADIKAWSKKVITAAAVLGAGFVGLDQVANAYLGLKQKYPEISQDISNLAE
jgi:hypothetical protein